MPSDIREGFLVTDVSGAYGGIVHKSKTKQTREGVVVTTVRTRDKNPKLTHAMKALVNKADYVCRSLCAWTQVGWVIARGERVALLSQQIADLRVEANLLNQLAASKRSPRRVRLGVVLSTFCEPEQQFEAVDRAVSDGLATLAELLRDGRLRDGKTRSPWRPTVLRMANLDTLLAGDKLTRYQEALHRAGEARRLYLEATAKPGSARRAAAMIDGYAKQIDDAVSWFVDDGVV